MNKLLFSVLSAVSFVIASDQLQASESVKIELPQAVKDGVYKRHPNAVDLVGYSEKHFGKELIDVKFNEETVFYDELFRLNGKFFVNKLMMLQAQDVPLDVIDVLKKEFPVYEFKQAASTVNPNGIGQDYELYISAEGKDWRVVINNQSELVSKDLFTF